MNANRPKKGRPERAAIRRQKLIGLLDDDVLHAGVWRRFCLPRMTAATADKNTYVNYSKVGFTFAFPGSLSANAPISSTAFTTASLLGEPASCPCNALSFSTICL